MSNSPSIKLIWKKSCDTCRRFKKELDSRDITYESREMNSEPLTATELDSLIGERELKPYLNTRNVVYRERKLSANPPTRDAAIALMAETNNLLRRPVFIVGDEHVIGARLDDALGLIERQS